MGSAARDIKNGLTKSLATFTKQRKAEERHANAGLWRTSRMTEVRGKSQKDAANEVMTDCYMKASDNNTLSANARQIFYAARPLIEGRTDKPLSYGYFSQTLLPNYLSEHPQQTADWDVSYDDRGHFTEPHTGLTIGLGTVAVRNYLTKVRGLKLDPASFAAATVDTHGPHGCFGALLYIEKEGFMSLLERVNLAERYDIAIMSSKGMSVTAARELADGICAAHGIPLLVLHDFDSAGIIIKDTLQHGSRRYRYRRAPVVIDIGLQYGDIDGLIAEPNHSNISDERLVQAGLDPAAIDFLNIQRVELNAMMSRQLVDFVEAKLKQHGIGKVVPSRRVLADAYHMFAASDRLSDAFEELKENLENETETPIIVPDNLEASVRDKLRECPTMTWYRAVRHIVDHDAEDDDDEPQQHGDDDLSEFDE